MILSRCSSGERWFGLGGDPWGVVEYIIPHGSPELVVMTEGDMSIGANVKVLSLNNFNFLWEILKLTIKLSCMSG